MLFDSAAGVNLRPQERRVGYLFQSYALFPNMTVEQNVGVGVGASKSAARVAEQLRAFRLDGLQKKRPAALRRPAAALALARIGQQARKSCCFWTEPFSALDGYLRWQQAGAHRHAAGVPRRLGLREPQPRRGLSHVRHGLRGLRRQSEPKLTVSELFSTPSTLAAALISGCKNVSRARKLTKGQSLCQLLDCEDWGVTLATSLPVPEGLSHVGVRAHYFRVVGDGEKPAGTEAAQNLIPCEVDRVIDNTFSTIAMLRTPGGGLLRYECEKDAWAALGEPDHLTVAIDPADVMPLSDGKAAGAC